MLRSRFLWLLVVLWHTPTYSQLVITGDTTLCEPGAVTLEILSAPSYGTESYTFQEVDYAPESYSGTSVELTDDSYGGPYSIGFSFCFLGNEYTQFYIGSNGWLSFGGVGALSTTYTSATIPSTGAGVPKNCIMGPWQDWHPGLCDNCIKYQTIGTAPNRKLVVSWDNVPMFSCTGTLGKFQIVLHETTNVIENHITDKNYCAWAGGTATQGVHSLSGTLAYTVPGRNSTVWTAENETVQFIPSGGSWYIGGTLIATGDSIVVNPLVTTTYTLELEGCGGETYTADVTVTIESDDASFSYDGLTEFCPDQIITPSYIAIPGGSFNIDPPGVPINSSTGAIDLTGATPGATYTIEYTTPPGPCSNTSSLVIEIVPYDDATFSYAASSFCPTGSVSPTVATPGGSFTISPTDMTINSSTGAITLSTGTVGTTYTITYTTAGYCPASSSTTVTIDPLDDPSFAYDSLSYCPFGLELPSSVETPGGTFTIFPSTMDIDPATGELDLSTGVVGATYTITYTTLPGLCSNSSTETVSINPLDNASFGYSAASYCAGGVVSPTFISTPGGTFSVSPSSLDVDPITGDVDLTTGTVGFTYAITYTTDSGPCSNSATVSITIDANDDSTFYYSADSYCAVGTTLPTVVTPGGSFSFSPAGLSLDAASGLVNLALSLPGVYTINYTTPAGFCSSSSSVSLTVTDFTDAFFEYDTSEYCNESSIIPYILNPGGSFVIPAGLSMDATTGEVNLAASSAGGPYTILYNSPGCTEQDTFQITIHPMPSPVLFLDELICIEADALLLSGEPAGGNFSGDAVTGSIFNPAAVDGPGIWPVTYTYTNEFNCTSSVTEFIEVVQHSVDAGDDVVIIEGNSTILAASGGIIFNWSPETGLSCSGCDITTASPGLGDHYYMVTSYDENGCVAYDEVQVSVIPFDDITVFVPNTFTPNGDQINDYLIPMGSDIEHIVSFSIFDRWGNTIWRGENITPGDQLGGWSGKSENGMLLDPGVYPYIVEVRLSFGVNKVVYGNVTLIR